MKKANIQIYKKSFYYKTLFQNLLYFYFFLWIVRRKIVFKRNEMKKIYDLFISKKFYQKYNISYSKSKKTSYINLEDCLGYAETGSGKTFAFLLAKFPYY